MLPYNFDMGMGHNFQQIGLNKEIDLSTIAIKFINNSAILVSLGSLGVP